MERWMRMTGPDPDDGRWLFVVSDADKTTYALFDSEGLQGGGYTWQAIARSLLTWRAPDLAAELQILAEGDEMYTYAQTPEPLERLAALLAEAAQDHSIMREAMARAGDELE
jgi:hypothetical protein